MKADIKVIRGTSNTFRITVADADGNLYNLGTGEKLIFGVKRSHEDTECIILKTATTGENGTYTITLDPSDTELCECCRYVYDVAIQSGDDYYSVIETSVFEVKKNVTNWGCA